MSNDEARLAAKYTDEEIDRLIQAGESRELTHAFVVLGLKHPRGWDLFHAIFGEPTTPEGLALRESDRRKRQEEETRDEGGSVVS